MNQIFGALSRAATLSAMALVMALAGCASSVKLDNPPSEVQTRDLNAQTGAAGSSVSAVDLTQTANASNAAAVNAGRVVYFDFDSFAVKDEYRPLIQNNSSALIANKQRRMTVEGHTDERGGREYNLALGQKRAEAVVRAMALLGVPTAQLEAVSYGEERPADTASNEAAWAKNRRAELKDR